MVIFNPKLYKECKLAKIQLDNHGVIAFPTETVMGLGVYFDDYEAYQKMNKIKGRPEDKPYTMMLGDVEEIEKYAVINEVTQRVINAFMPGSITILVPVKKDVVPDYVTHSTGIIGIRVPRNFEALCVLKNAKKPLLVPSANVSGQKPAMNSTEVESIFGDQLDYIIEGRANGGVPSTIVDLTKETPVIVRKGPITKEQILEKINKY